MRVVIVMLALGLAACGSPVDGTELGGISQWYGTTPAPAVRAANEHCNQYGRIARVTQVEPWRGYLAFSCDKPERS